MKRLKGTSGSVVDISPRDGDVMDRIVRPAILVHVGSFICGEGDISFDDSRIERVVSNHNAMISKLAEGYGGVAKMPVGAFPPILDMHDDSDSTDRIIGRLASLLRFERRDIPGVGKNIACATADITFLGKETVDRVKDGRIYHLSIGIDELTDTLGETSTVITPAAPGAMLLKKGEAKRPNGGKKMSDKIKRLEAAKARKSKLTALKESLTTLGKKVTESSELMKLTQKKGAVTKRLMGLMQSGRLTPAEFKKMDMAKLTALPAEQFNTIAESFDVREPVIIPGQKGSQDAAVFSELGKGMEKKQFKTLKGEVYKDFKRLGKKMKGGEEFENDKDKKMSGPKEEEIQPGKDEHAVSGEEQVKMAAAAKHMSDMGKCLESGDVEGAKKCYAEMSKGGMKHMSMGMGDVKSEDYMASMNDLQTQVDELTTQMGRLGGMVEELMTMEEAEEGEAEMGVEGSEDVQEKDAPPPAEEKPAPAEKAPPKEEPAPKEQDKPAVQPEKKPE